MNNRQIFKSFSYQFQFLLLICRLTRLLSTTGYPGLSRTTKSVVSETSVKGNLGPAANELFHGMDYLQN